MPGYWLVKSINRFSMSPPSHKGFFSSYNLEKKFGTFFSGHSFTQIANGHTYVMTEKPYSILKLDQWKLKHAGIQSQKDLEKTFT